MPIEPVSPMINISAAFPEWKRDARATLRSPSARPQTKQQNQVALDARAYPIHRQSSGLAHALAQATVSEAADRRYRRQSPAASASNRSPAATGPPFQGSSCLQADLLPRVS